MGFQGTFQSTLIVTYLWLPFPPQHYPLTPPSTFKLPSPLFSLSPSSYWVLLPLSLRSIFPFPQWSLPSCLHSTGASG